MASDLTNKQLQAQAAALAKEAARDGGKIAQIAATMRDEAQHTRRTGNQISAMNVDPATVSENEELAKSIDGLSDVALAYCTTAQDTTRYAEWVASTAGATHDGIGEAVNRSPAQGIHDVNREWFTQE